MLLPDYEYERLRDILVWFSKNLETPDRFSPSSRRGRGRSKAVCWFKPTAHEHLAHAREMASLLEDYGVPIWTLKSSKVGYVVYEDVHQVVAEPDAYTRLWC